MGRSERVAGFLPLDCHLIPLAQFSFSPSPPLTRARMVVVNRRNKVAEEEDAAQLKLGPGNENRLPSLLSRIFQLIILVSVLQISKTQDAWELARSKFC